MTNKQGIFIILEGDDGCGKGEQLKRLIDFLSKQGIDFITTHEPGGGDLKIREKLQYLDGLSFEEELNLFLEDRKLHYQNVIGPALEAGKIVVCDRSFPSTIAYQGYGRGMDIEKIKRRNKKAIGDIEPDKIILLDGDPQIFRERLIKRGLKETRFEKEGLEFHQRVREGYLTQAKKDPGRWCVINAELSPDEVWEQIKKCIGPVVKNGILR